MKPSSRSAFVESKYQKYSAISISEGSTGGASFHCLKMELIPRAPATASFDGRERKGAGTFVMRSSRPKNLSKVQLAAPRR